MRDKAESTHTVPRGASGLIGEWELGDLPDLQWAIEDVVPTECLCVLYGASGSGKSLLALDMSMAIALGRPWCGHPVEEGRPAIYVCGEGFAGMGQRVGFWKRQHGVTSSVNLYFLRHAFELLNPVAVADFINDLTDPTGHLGGELPGLVVLETLRTCLGGESEDSADTMGLATANAYRIVEATGATVLIIHHTGWNKARERGSSALRAAADVMLKLEADGDNISLKCDKARDFSPFKPIALRVERPLSGGAVIVERDPGPTGDTFGPKHRQLLAVLRDLGEAGSSTQWQQASAESIEGMARRTFYRHLGFLLDQGYVLQLEQRYALTQEGLALLVPSAIQVPSGANGTGQLVPQVPHPFRGGTGTDPKDDTGNPDREVEMVDAPETLEGHAAP